MTALQVKLLAAILGVITVVGAAYLRNSREDHRPAYVLTEQDKQLSKKLAQHPPATYLEP
jgi:hypothetical protein